MFSEDYKKEFDCIFDLHEIPEKPTVYINISSKYNPTDAPTGCENWFVMINSPADYGQHWEKIIEISRKSIIEKINEHLNVNIADFIETEEILSPPLIEKKTGSNRGSLYGSSSNTRMSAFMRQANFSSKIKGLYFCGGSVHPGGGIPLCLYSAKIISELVPKTK